MKPILNRSHLLNSVYFYFLYLFRPGHHHVHIEEGVGQLGLQTLDDGMAKGQVGHKMPVHDVQVEVVCSGIKQPPLEENLSFFQIFFLFSRSPPHPGVFTLCTIFGWTGCRDSNPSCCDCIRHATNELQTKF